MEYSHVKKQERDIGGNVTVDAIRYVITYPYEGDRRAFSYKPSHYLNGHALEAIIGPDTITLVVVVSQNDAEAVMKALNRKLEQIEFYLRNIRTQMSSFSDSIRNEVGAAIDARKKRVLSVRNLVNSLPFRLKSAQDSTAYELPLKRNPLKSVSKPSSNTPFMPEPMLLTKDYEDIIKIINNMGVMFERSPNTFSDMSEEGIRDHILVQLNGRLEGAASGETFNGSGKTDILVRVKDRNIFIAECKIWRGPKAFIKALDQLLGYVTWRDTKTAVILFNKSGDLSKILSQVPCLIADYPNTKKRVAYPCETAFRFILGRSDDRNRDMILTVLVFDVLARRQTQ